jgi:AraC-like DNA-binding protein
MSYGEWAVVSSPACCTWEQRTETTVRQRIVPDGCVDLVWAGERLLVAGPDTHSRFEVLAPGTRIVGVRLRPGRAGEVLGRPASDVRDCSPDAGEVLGRDAADRLLEALRSGGDAHALLLAEVTRRGRAGGDPLVLAAVEALNRPGARVSAVAAQLGLSPRQLQRRLAGAVGYGPKMLARVLRFRRLQALADLPLVESALAAGYADQAHMTTEVSRLAGISPVRFLKDGTSGAA